MKYKTFSLLLILLPLVVQASENSREFAQYDSELRILSLPDVGIDDARIYYSNSTKLHLGEDGGWEPIDLGEALINNSPELFKINNYNSESGVLSMPILEVDNNTAYRNVKIQLGSNWRILQIEKENCNLTLQQASQLRACMTLVEIENIVGCPGVLEAQGSFAFLGFGSNYIWRDFSVALRSLGTNSEFAISIDSSKFDLHEFVGGCP